MLLRSSSFRVIAASALLLLPLGCEGVVLRSDLDPVYQELRSLRRDYRQLAARYEGALGEGQETQATLRSDLQSARGAIESARRSQADLETRLEGVRREVEKQTSISEEGRHLAQKTDREVTELQKELDSRLKGIEEELKLVKARLGIAGPGTPEGKVGAALTPGTKTPAPAEVSALPSEEGEVPPRAPAPKPQEQEAPPPKPEVQAKVPGGVLSPPVPLPEELEYHRALSTLREKQQYDLARRMFEKFIKKYPLSELADNAQYWIGETYYVENKYERAILAFAEVQEKYKEGDKVPDAVLKQALSFAALGDKNAAKDLLRQLISRFPASPAAGLAKQKLGEL